jgi:predicted acyl esterase
MRFKTLGLAVLLAALLAGSASAAEVETVPFESEAADGIVLRGHAFLPVGRERPLATVLQFSPYFEDTDQVDVTDSVGPRLLDAGFAVSYVSMRGTGRSDGCLRFGDGTDWTDAHTVVQALAAQPWSNGRIGMYGHSYPAWTQFMAAATKPPALKAAVPTSGVVDLWSLLNRRGAPLSYGGSSFAPVFTGATGHPPPDAVEQLACPELATAYRENFENAVSGDRTQWFVDRDLRQEIEDTAVPIMASIGIISGINDGHILQFEGLWDILNPANTHLVLGQWSHETPADYLPAWNDQVIGWFDHYLRGGPKRTETGVVQYQDDSDQFHKADRWPPPSRTETLHLSGDRAVAEGEKVEPVDAIFQSADNDPGLKTAPPDEKIRLYNSTCGPHQALFASEPLAEDAVLAGNFVVDLELTSTLPGGNLSVFLWRTTASGACPDPTSTWFGRALMDLRHFETPGDSRDFPVGAPTRVRYSSHPFAAKMRKGERIVIAIGGGSSELEPDRLHPQLRITKGRVELPVVTGGIAAARSAPHDAQGGGDRPGATPATRAACVEADGFSRASVRPSGRGLDFRFRARAPVTVDVFQTSRGRRVLGVRRVARFTGRRAAFRWNGRGRRVSDGTFFVRYTTRVDGVRDVRRVTLRRSRGRFAVIRPHYLRAGCDVLRAFKLSSPTFGGKRRALGIAFRLTEPASVGVTVRRGGRVVKRFAARPRPAGRTVRLTLPARGLRRGDHRVTLRARTPGGRTVARTLGSRRL